MKIVNAAFLFMISMVLYNLFDQQVQSIYILSGLPLIILGSIALLARKSIALGVDSNNDEAV